VSDTGTFDLSPVFDALALEVGPEHAIHDLDPAAVLDTPEIPEDILGVSADETDLPTE
jgi:hypothetical protein